MAEVPHEVLHNLSSEAVEGELANDQLHALLVLSDLVEHDTAGIEALGLLHAASVRGRLVSSWNAMAAMYFLAPISRPPPLRPHDEREVMTMGPACH
jgi:hypothetical protein